MKQLILLPLFTLVFLYTSACGKGPELGQFSSYVWRFQGEANKRGVEAPDDDIVVRGLNESQMAPYRAIMGDTIIGVCEHPNKIVDIYLPFWYAATETQKEELIFHELGHCILNRHHKLDRDFHRNPVSLMYPTLLDENTYTKHRTAYLDELFSSDSPE